MQVIPKDALCVSRWSLRWSAHPTQIRKAVVMTGEITLRGQVLPVGGIMKIPAAKRAGIKEIICERTAKTSTRSTRGTKGLTTFVSDIMEVVNRAVLQTKAGNHEMHSCHRTHARHIPECAFDMAGARNRSSSNWPEMLGGRVGRSDGRP